MAGAFLVVRAVFLPTQSGAVFSAAGGKFSGAVSQEEEIKGKEISKEKLNSLYLQTTQLSNYTILRTLQKHS